MDQNFNSQPYFHISVVSEMLDLHPQTIRNYERMGLINPARTDGKVRRFSQKDVNKVNRIKTFTGMGINLAGVEIILKLLEQLDEMEKELKKLEEQSKHINSLKEENQCACKEQNSEKRNIKE